jgi:hypothetical protein
MARTPANFCPVTAARSSAESSGISKENFMNQRTIRKLHKWVGVIFCLSALLASGSGVLHIVMTRTQTAPPPARPAGALDLSGVMVSPAQAASSLPAEKQSLIQAVSIRSVEGKPWYQILVKDEAKPRYVDAIAAVEDEEQDEIYAASIASGFLNGALVRKTDYLTSFNREYLNIYRILPVYRFDIDDGKGTRLYVSSLTGSVTRHTDNRKQWEANIFSNFHKLAFIENKKLRDVVLTATTFGIFIASCLGLLLFVWRR